MADSTARGQTFGDGFGAGGGASFQVSAISASNTCARRSRAISALVSATVVYGMPDPDTHGAAAEAFAPDFNEAARRRVGFPG